MAFAIANMPDELFAKYICEDANFWHLLCLREVSKDWMRVINSNLRITSETSLPSLQYISLAAHVEGLDLQSLSLKPQTLNLPASIYHSLSSLILDFEISATELSLLSNLTTLSLSNCGIALDPAVASLKKLETLHLYNTELSNAAISSLYSLRLLAVDRSPKITSADFSALTSLTELQTETIVAEDISHLSQLRLLRAMRIIGSFAHLPPLLALSLTHYNSDDAELACMTQLERLDISHTYGSTDAAIQPLTNLTHLNLRLDANSQVTLDCLSDLTDLRILSIASIDLLGLSETTTSRLTNLREFRSTRFSYHRHSIDALCQLTSLEKLWLGLATEECISELSRLENLHQLALTSSHVTDAALSELTQLRSLRLDKDINEISGVSLSQMPRLKTLVLRDSSSSCSEYLHRLTQLQELYISQTNSVQGSMLSGLTNLTLLFTDEVPNVRAEDLYSLRKLRGLDGDLADSSRALMKYLPELEPLF